ncbi:hypothetical protein SEPCBS119000_004160 [Sporothrix epigloea]|uniref:F-box domain-containing protein n=1 Tax=Sporothrix epigloea TaxID=1892477 RepID=A0ABP0DQK0_9PEZI
MDLLLPTAGKKRALPVDQPIPAVASEATTVQRVIRKSTRIVHRQAKRDIESGYFTASQMRDVLQERRLLYEDWHKRHSKISDQIASCANKDRSKIYSQLDEAWQASNTRRPGFLNFSGGKQEAYSEGRTIKIYTQSIANSRGGDNGSTRALTICAPHTLLPWTKYYLGVENPDGEGKDAADTLASLSIQPAPARSILSPIQIPPPLLPAPKRLLISRSVSLGKPDIGASENDTAAVQFKTLGAASYPSQPAVMPTGTTSEPQFDLISSLSSCPEVVTHVCKYLNLGDILVLYRTSRLFKSTFDSDLERNVQRMARQFASAETRSVFSWRRITESGGRLLHMVSMPRTRRMHEIHGRSPQTSSAPTLRYVGMMVSRERKVRDIVATLARAGHRLPRTNATAVLKKIWLLMDIPTNNGRELLLKDEALFSDLDLLTMQMFHVKLVLHFHDPLMGPDNSLAETQDDLVPGIPDVPQELIVDDLWEDGQHSSNEEMAAAAAAARDYILQHQRQLPEHSLVETLLGQRAGLEVLWSMLRGKAYRTLPEVVSLKARYDCEPHQFFGQYATRGICHEHYDGSNSFSFELDADNNWNSHSFSTTGEGLSCLENTSFFSSGEQSSSAETGSLKDFASDGLAHESDLFCSLQDDPLVDVLGTGVPVSQMGKDHLEGWGTGNQHLLRPDELVPLEAARRMQESPDNHLDLSCHVPFMAIWGNRDFATGANLMPDVDEMYISDDEHDALGLDSLSSDDGDGLEDSHENKENFGVCVPTALGYSAFLGTHGADQNQNPAGKERAAIAALVAKSIDEDMYPMAEHRLQAQSGNVLVDRDAWQPWQVLKARWDTLTLRERVDVWWVSHQYRLHRQAWTQREGQDRSNVQGGQPDPAGLSQISYTQSDAISIEEAQYETDDMDLDLDVGTEAEDFDDGVYSAEDEENGEGYVGNDSELHGTRTLTPDRGSSQPSTPPNDYDSLSFSLQLPRRHQKLIESSIQSALREQDEVDEALLAQADMSYEADEVAHWDEFLAEAGQMLAGLDIVSLDHEINDESWLSEEPVAATPMPNPEEVLMPEYGGLNDVFRLVQQVHEAQADVDAAQLMVCTDGPFPGSDVRVSQSKDTVLELTARLELLLKAEVFAIDL